MRISSPLPGFRCQDSRLSTVAIVGFVFIPITLASRSEVELNQRQVREEVRMLAEVGKQRGFYNPAAALR